MPSPRSRFPDERTRHLVIGLIMSGLLVATFAVATQLARWRWQGADPARSSQQLEYQLQPWEYEP